LLAIASIPLKSAYLLAIASVGSQTRFNERAVNTATAAAPLGIADGTRGELIIVMTIYIAKTIISI